MSGRQAQILKLLSSFPTVKTSSIIFPGNSTRLGTKQHFLLCILYLEWRGRVRTKAYGGKSGTEERVPLVFSAFALPTVANNLQISGPQAQDLPTGGSSHYPAVEAIRLLFVCSLEEYNPA